MAHSLHERHCRADPGRVYGNAKVKIGASENLGSLPEPPIPGLPPNLAQRAHGLQNLEGKGEAEP